ncbi:hypothetical protein V8G57_11635 [Collimonas sp. H4R21]|uniref:Phage baseplate protein n=1 Tax=Collimonas rhizosphaerae TaxID=3126357 RepID=A0ABU9PVQ3_9BURK
MRTLSASELLGVWERGRVQGPIEQALLLLATACPDASADELDCLPIGLRDHALLTLRESTFGSSISSVVECPRCGERLEFDFHAAELCRDSPSDVVATKADSEAENILLLDIEGYALRFRCVNSQDLAALQRQALAADDQGRQLGRYTLLERCVLTAQRDGDPVLVRSLPGKVVDALESRMAQADPHADLRLAVSCPNCHLQWHAIFDIVSFFWREIDTWAKRILHEVHVLARAYGWREQDILNLSPLRRQCYIDMVGA